MKLKKCNLKYAPNNEFIFHRILEILGKFSLIILYNKIVYMN